MTQYAGKKVVITGGTTGMGRGIAEALLERGAQVLLTGQDPKRLEETQRALGSRAHVVRSDAAKLADIDQLKQEVARKLGRIDALFISAGYCKISLFDEVSEAEYDRTFGINTKGPFFTLQRLAPLLNDGSGVVLITSIADAVGYPGMSVYAGTKGALRSFGQGFAAELLPRKIRVNSLSPGFIATPTMGVVESSPAEREAFVAEGVRATPLGRIGSIEEVARAALFLAFDATFTTGTELLLDGGMTQVHLPTEV
ncbi:MAG: SDR family oxidoreductase [Polyangiales bacterium]